MTAKEKHFEQRELKIMFTYGIVWRGLDFIQFLWGSRGNLLSESLVFTLGRAKLDLTVFSISQEYKINLLAKKHVPTY